jgi:hypothetical protein
MTTLLQDSFNRANGALGSPDVGGPYTIHSGAPVISGNRLGGIALFTAPCAINLNINITNVSAVSGGLVFRYIDANNYWYYGIASGQLQLFRHQGGVQRLFFHTRVPNAANQLTRIVAKDKIIGMYVGTGCVGTVEDPYFSSATVSAGVWNTQPTAFDDLLVTDDLSLITSFEGTTADVPDSQVPSDLQIPALLLKGLETATADAGSSY